MHFARNREVANRIGDAIQQLNQRRQDAHARHRDRARCAAVAMTGKRVAERQLIWFFCSVASGAANAQVHSPSKFGRTGGMIDQYVDQP